MNFSDALEALKCGNSVARAAWDGQWLLLVEHYRVPQALGLRLRPFIGIKTADGCFGPYTSSQADELADDWGLAPRQTDHFDEDDDGWFGCGA